LKVLRILKAEFNKYENRRLAARKTTNKSGSKKIDKRHKGKLKHTE